MESLLPGSFPQLSSPLPSGICSFFLVWLKSLFSSYYPGRFFFPSFFCFVLFGLIYFSLFFFSIYIWYCMQLLIDWQVGITWARPKSKWVILQVCFCLLPIFVFVLNIIGNGMASLCKIWLFSFSFLFCSDLCWFIIACAGFGSEFNSIWGK
jgi:hypothetical protein